jgi:large subunit ribosomal protein L15
MKIHELSTTKSKSIKRLGRGISGGQGKTAGRGTKGQNSRTGSKFKPGFEGGQTKLAMRLPKARGFKALNRTEYRVVNISDLEDLAKKTVDAKVLEDAGVIRTGKNPLKLLGNGTIKTAVTITVDKASASAVAAVEKAGGKVIITPAKTKTQKPVQKESK